MSVTAKRLTTLLRSGAATPIPLTISGLFAWWDTSDLATLFQDSAGATPVTATNDPVGMLKDKSGNARHLIQSGAGTLKPTYQGAGGGISSDGGDTLKVTGLGTAFTAQTVIAVFMPTATTSFGRLFTQWTTTADYNEVGHYLPILRNSTNAEFCSYATTGARSAVSVTNNQKYLFVSQHTGSALTNRANAVDGAEYTHSFSKTINGMAIFADDLGTSNLTGRLYELLVFNTAISSGDRAALEAYLNAKWGSFLP